MSAGRSLLHTYHDGAPDGAPLLVLHDRLSRPEAAREFGAALGPNVLRIAVGAPRVQVTGASGVIQGYYWYIGAIERPELSTLGDGLYQLELLLLDTSDARGGRKIGLYGAGEGGVLCLLTALIWPDKVSCLIIEDPVLPTNLADMPLDLLPLAGLPVLLIGDATPLAAYLTAHGATVTIAPDRQGIATFAAAAH